MREQRAPRGGRARALRASQARPTARPCARGARWAPGQAASPRVGGRAAPQGPLAARACCRRLALHRQEAMASGAAQLPITVLLAARPAPLRAAGLASISWGWVDRTPHHAGPCGTQRNAPDARAVLLSCALRVCPCVCPGPAGARVCAVPPGLAAWPPQRIAAAPTAAPPPVAHNVRGPPMPRPRPSRGSAREA